jgi:hypothetical protein
MDASSLADLKAEVERKRNEAKLTKLLVKEPKSKPDPIWAAKKSSSEAKPSKTGYRVEPEEEKRVQAALELKSRLYNQMKSGEVSMVLVA